MRSTHNFKKKLTVFVIRVLREIFAQKREDLPGKWRRLHNEELYHLYSSPYFIGVIKSRRMQWVVLVARLLVWG
jgi:hypothetical protein